MIHHGLRATGPYRSIPGRSIDNSDEEEEDGGIALAERSHDMMVVVRAGVGVVVDAAVEMAASLREKRKDR